MRSSTVTNPASSAGTPSATCSSRSWRPRRATSSQGGVLRPWCDTVGRRGAGDRAVPVVLKAKPGAPSSRVRLRSSDRRGVSDGLRSCPRTRRSRPLPDAALAGADQIVIGPGSLFTSVLAACVAAADREAMCAATHAGVRTSSPTCACRFPETVGLRHRALSLGALRRARGSPPDAVVAGPAGTASGRCRTASK